MGKFATFILDSDLESVTIREISKMQGELVLRGVNAEQLGALPADVAVVTNKELCIGNRQLMIKPSMNASEIAEILSQNLDSKTFFFDKAGATVFGLMGLSGGVGVTSIALNFAFELALQSQVLLIDLDQRFPEIARNLNIHRIMDAPQRVGPNLQVIQGLPRRVQSKKIVLDCGDSFEHPILEYIDHKFLVARLNPNTLSRLQMLTFIPEALVINFYERSKLQQQWLKEIQKEIPGMKILLVPLDSKSFEVAANAKSALCEISPNSPARKHIATLG